MRKIAAFPVIRTAADMADDDTRGVIPLVEEELHLSKRQVTKGRVRVRTVVDTVEEIAAATLDMETVEVTRVPVGKEIAQAPAVRTEGDVVIVPVVEEVLVVEKRLVLKEELHIRRRVESESVEVPVTLRKERAVIERFDPNSSRPTDKDPTR